MKPPSPQLEVVSNGSDADPELERLLLAARESAEPLPVNRERVTRALGEALPVSMAALAPAESARAGARAGSRPALGATAGAVGRTEGATRMSGAWWRTGGLLVGGLLLGGLGFRLGHDRGHSEGMAQGLRDGRLEQVARDAASGSALPSAAPSEPGAPRPPPAVGWAVPPAAAEAARPERDAPVATRQRTRAAADAPRRAARDDARENASPEARAASLTFRQVLEQLHRAQQQLRAGQAAMSLLILSELDRAAADLLFEEREATRVLALCAAGQGKAARAAARRLEETSPGSIYSPRLSTSCAAAGASGDDAALDRLADPNPTGPPSGDIPLR